MLKEVLMKWKEETEGKGLRKQEQVEKMKALVANTPELLANPFFQQIKAL